MVGEESTDTICDLKGCDVDTVSDSLLGLKRNEVRNGSKQGLKSFVGIAYDLNGFVPGDRPP